tara:strand:- start:34428 stop:35435 length:1008 start_codon:yes stop_codon:yes gene_type:complete
MYYFCTYFDSNFLVTGLSLYRSLQEQCPRFKLWVLCLDDECFDVLSSGDYPNLVAVQLSDLESSDLQLAEARKNRSLIEYYFTCTASFSLYLLRHFKEIDLITYLDADLYFFSDPAPVYEELMGSSIGIIEHRFPESMKKLERYGVYNVGWVSFRRDEAGLACLELWREQCIDWCYDRLEAGRFADQKYLDSWPHLFDAVRVIQHKGANLAPWNVARYTVGEKCDLVTVDDQPLIFFHFHGLKKVSGLPLYNTGLGDNRAVLNSTLRNGVYRHYLAAKLKVSQEFAASDYAVPTQGSVRTFVNDLWKNPSMRSFSKVLIAIYSLFICRAYLIFRA